jgi:hypothetical protein
VKIDMSWIKKQLEVGEERETASYHSYADRIELEIELFVILEADKVTAGDSWGGVRRLLKENKLQRGLERERSLKEVER